VVGPHRGAVDRRTPAHPETLRRHLPGPNRRLTSVRFFEGVDVPAPNRARLLKHRHFEIPWTEPQARAFQLLHILPHELGHHHDRITSRQQHTLGRGEPYAERYANQVLETLWPSYTDSK
jgi:hypothetical protein